MLPYEKSIFVYGVMGLRRTDIPKPEDFENLTMILENIFERNDSKSMSLLANFYEHGCVPLGILPDEDKATYWYGLAAKRNDLDGMYYYGNRLVANSNSGENMQLQNLGFDYMKKAADGGLPRAQYMVGLAYKLGITGEQNFEKALFYLNKALLAGETEADEIIREIESYGV